jgi:hypothetical protein
MFGVADWVIWYIISQYVGLGVVGGYLVYKTRFKIGFKAVFLRKDVAGWYVIGEKEFKANADTVNFNKKDFGVKLEKLSYRKHGFQYLYFDFDTGDLLCFGGVHTGIDPKDADLFLSSGIIQRIIMGLKGVGMFTLGLVVVMVVVAVLCFVVGLFVSPYVLPVGNSTVVR